MRKTMIVLIGTLMVLLGNAEMIFAADYDVQDVAAVDFNNDASLCNVNILSQKGSLNNTGTQLKMYAFVSSKSNSSISIKIQLQQKKSGSWSTIKTWKKTYSSQTSASMEQTYTGTKNCTYRMKYTVTVGSESSAGTTSQVTL